ncbi:hypothetical protein LINGRAHAP2_LOCUS18476 [Linum grandiflorum]
MNVQCSLMIIKELNGVHEYICSDMDTGHEKGSSTRDSQTESSTRDPQTESSSRDPQSLPVVDQKEDEQEDNIETYPKLRIRSETEGFPVVLGHDQTSIGDEISSNNSSFDHFDVDPEILNREMTDKISSEPIHPEQNNESSRNGSFQINSGSEHLESQPETVDDGGGSHVEESRLLTLSQSEDQPRSEDNKPISPIIKMGSSSSSSSSSSESSLKNGPFPGDLNDDFDPRSPGEEKQQARDTISEQNKPEEADSSSVSPVAASPGSEITLSGISPIQSPPVQVMQRSEEYDPNRIPASIFQRSSSDAQNDWSIASNESLFSIHVGTSTSFSREQAAFIKAEEVVPKQNEPFSFSHRNRSDETPESPNSPTAFPVSELADADAVTASSPALEPLKQNAKKETEIISTTPVQNRSPESARRAAAAEEERRSSNQKRAPIVSWRSNSNSNHSDKSQNSTKSFAFPILNDEGRLDSSSTAVNKEEQRQETVTTTATVVAPPRKVKRRWYRFLCCCPWKGGCCCSCSSCRCFRCSKCCRC